MPSAHLSEKSKKAEGLQNKNSSNINRNLLDDEIYELIPEDASSGNSKYCVFDRRENVSGWFEVQLRIVLISTLIKHSWFLSYGHGIFLFHYVCKEKKVWYQNTMYVAFWYENILDIHEEKGENLLMHSYKVNTRKCRCC